MERIAEVIKNNALTQSPELVENGAIQVYIEDLMQDITVDMYPWVMPKKEFSSNIPEVGEFVWVEFMDELNWRNGFYGNNVTLKEAFTHSSTIGSMTSVYPDVKYITLANGVSLALSSNATTPEVSISHPSGAEIYIDPDGMVSIKGAAGVLEATLLGETTIQLLSDLIDAILAITVTTPAGLSTLPLPNAASFLTLQSTLNTLLSQEVKNS